MIGDIGLLAGAISRPTEPPRAATWPTERTGCVTIVERFADGPHRTRKTRYSAKGRVAVAGAPERLMSAAP